MLTTRLSVVARGLACGTRVGQVRLGATAQHICGDSNEVWPHPFANSAAVGRPLGLLSGPSGVALSTSRIGVRQLVGISAVRLAPQGSERQSVIKRPSDPERPKKPTSPFFRYLAHYRTQQQPGVKPTEAVKAAAAEWKTVTDKSRWVQPYEVDKEEYERQMSTYVASGKKDAWKRDPAKPKVPMTGFLRYASEFRSKHSEMKTMEASKAAGAAWKAALPAERAPYEQAYAKEKQLHGEAMQKYKASGQEEAWKERVGIKALEDKAANRKLKLKDTLLEKRQKQKAKLADAKQKKEAVALAKKEKAAAAKNKKMASATLLKKKKEAALMKKKAAAAAKKKKAAATAADAAAAKKKAANAAAAKKKMAAAAAKKKKMAADATKKKKAAAEVAKNKSKLLATKRQKATVAAAKK